MPTINSIYYIESSESPIFNESYESLKKILKRIWGEEIEVYGTIQDSDINREQGRIDQKVGMKPYFVLRPSSFEDNLNSYNGFSLKKYGTKPVRAENGYFYGFHLKPCKLLCSVSFYCTSMPEMLKFMSTWHFNSREFTFALDVGGYNVDIHVDVEPTLTVPTRDLSGPNPLRVEANLSLYTYTGNVYKSPAVETLTNELYIVKTATILDWEELAKKDIKEAEDQLIKVLPTD